MKSIFRHLLGGLLLGGICLSACKKAQNLGDYYNGLAVEAPVADGLDRNWGDPQESCLAAALNYIGVGSFASANNRNTTARLSAQQQVANQTLDRPKVRELVLPTPHKPLP